MSEIITNECPYKGECQYCLNCVDDCYIKELLDDYYSLEKRYFDKEKECEELKKHYKLKLIMPNGIDINSQPAIEETEVDLLEVIGNLVVENNKLNQTLQKTREYCIQNKHSGWVDIDGIMQIIDEAEVSQAIEPQEE